MTPGWALLAGCSACRPGTGECVVFPVGAPCRARAECATARCLGGCCCAAEVAADVCAGCLCWAPGGALDDVGGCTLLAPLPAGSAREVAFDGVAPSLPPLQYVAPGVAGNAEGEDIVVALAEACERYAAVGSQRACDRGRRFVLPNGGVYYFVGTSRALKMGRGA